MVEHAPEALIYLGRQVPGLGGELSGIVGDSAHTYGYHRARSVLPSGDYSVRLGPDRLGDAEAASAIDMSFPEAQMVRYTSRLAVAADSNDPRLQCIREFYGTVDGNNVAGRTHSSETGGWQFASSDDSHLWHIHVSFFRAYSNSVEAVNAVLSVMRGEESYSSGEDDEMARLVISGQLPLGFAVTPQDQWIDVDKIVLPAFPEVGIGILKYDRAYISFYSDFADVTLRVATYVKGFGWGLKTVIVKRVDFKTSVPLPWGCSKVSVARVVSAADFMTQVDPADSTKTVKLPGAVPCSYLIEEYNETQLQGLPPAKK